LGDRTGLGCTENKRGGYGEGGGRRGGWKGGGQVCPVYRMGGGEV